MMRGMGQSGLTLVEVIIYASLSLLLIGLALGSLGTVQRGFFRNNEMARMRGDADEAIQIMGRDIRNLGVKRLFYATGPGAFVDTLIAAASYAPGDSSSFLHRDGPRYDGLTFLRARLDARGRPLGVDTVSYLVDPSSQTLIRTVNREPPSTLCDNVEALQFEYGISARRRVLVAETPPDGSRWTASPSSGMMTEGSSLALKVSDGSGGTVTAWQSASGFSTVSHRRYAFDLTGQVDADLLAGVDSMVALICTPTGTLVASERFLLGTIPTRLRVEMDAPPCGDCRAGIRMSLSSPGKLNLTSFTFQEVSQGDLTWSAVPDLGAKKSMRAVRIHLLVGTDRPVQGVAERSMRMANATMTFRDNRGRSLLDEVIPTPNNGP